MKKEKKAVKTKPVKPVIPKNCQQSVPYMECYENGVFQVEPGVFSRSYMFRDTTFKTLSQEKQDDMYQSYQVFLNSLNPEENFAFHFVNQPENLSEKLIKLAPKARADELTVYREELTNILGDKIRNARNNIATNKYFTVTIKSDSVAKAMQRFLDLDEELSRSFKKMTKEEVAPMSLAERLELLHTIYEPDNDNHFFEHDENGKTSIDWTRVKKLGLTTKDIVAPSALKFDATSFMIGERYGQALFLDNIANWLNSNFLAELSESTFESSINMHIRQIPQEDGLKKIHNASVAITAEVMEKQQKAIKAGYDPNFISMDLKNAKEQIDNLQEDMMNRDQKVFYFNMVITHFAESKEQLKSQYEQLKKTASKYMCSIKPLTLQQERGLKASLPVGCNPVEITRLMTTESLGVFIPFNESSTFDTGGFYYGLNAVNKTVVAINRLKGQNYNGMILGASGSGKSFAAKREIVNSLLATNDQIFVIDPDGEYTPLARAFGGTVIKIAPGVTNYLNPMDLDVDTSQDTEGNPVAMKIDFVAGLLETIQGGMPLSPTQKSIVDRCVRQIYADYMEHLSKLPPDASGKKRTIDRDFAPTLQNLYDALLKQPQVEAQNLALAMETYTTGSFDTFAHRTNVDISNRFIIYDIRDIGSNLRDLGLKVCMSDIWNHMIENRGKGIWTRAYIDEFHLLLSSPSSSEFCKSIWKRARKWWGVPTGITQNVEDLLLSPAARAIINNSNFMMMLNQSSFDRDSLQDILKLSDTDVEFITNADAGSGLIYMNGRSIPFKDEFPKDTELYRIMSTKE